MPTRDDDFRARHQVARAQILRENFDDVLSAWLTNYVRAEVLDTWGQPDTSNVPLVSYCRQLTTPGRYYKRPSLSHPSEGAEGLIAPGGKMDQAGIFSKLQTVEYLTTGLGDYFVRIDHSERGLHYRLIDPANVYLEKDPDSGETVLWWELRARYLPDEGCYVWTYDAFYLGDKHTGREPYYRILNATKTDEGHYEDMSHRFLRHSVDGEETTGALEGEAYPFRYKESGAPFLPVVQYISLDDGQPWHWTDLRGLHRGTLQACSYATYTGRAALDATGSHALAFGLEPPAADTRPQSLSPYDSGLMGPSQAPVRQMSITPGTITFCETTGGVQPGVQIIGPGINLDSLSKFTRGYTHDLMSQRGVGGGLSVEKTGANPASGAALYISDRSRREYQEKTEPLYRRMDVELMKKSAAVCNLATGTDYPEDRAYSIVYATPPRSPQEEKEARDAADWNVANGYRSKVDTYIDRNPGVSREEALDQLADIGREAAILDGMIEGEPVEVADGEPQDEAPDVVIDEEAQADKAVALNGAQIQAAQSIVEGVSLGSIPRESGISMLVGFLGIAPEAAEAVMGSIGRGFQPATIEEGNT